MKSNRASCQVEKYPQFVELKQLKCIQLLQPVNYLMRAQKRIPRCNSTFSSASVMQCKVIQNSEESEVLILSHPCLSCLFVLSSELVKIVVQSS